MDGHAAGSGHLHHPSEPHTPAPKETVPPPMEKHPEETHPLGMPYEHNPRERRTIGFLTLCLIATIIFIPILAGMSYSPIPNVLVGLSPLLAAIVIDLMLAHAHYKRMLFWPVLIITHILGLVWIHACNFLLENTVNVAQAVAVSLFFALPITVLAWLLDGGGKLPRVPQPLPRTFTIEELPHFVHSIEDKAKALNFAVGRVYRNSNGGSAQLRDRLRIPRDWYNEFGEAEEAERIKRAKVLVGKIHDRLLLYRKTEHELFSSDEVAKLKNSKRKLHGESRIIDVLVENDSDPVQQYYESALETCEEILKGLAEK